MSRANIEIFKEIWLGKKELQNLIIECEGYLLANHTPTGVIENGESTVWIYYIEDMKNNFDTIDILKNKHNFFPQTMILIEMSSDDGSDIIALNFTKKFMGSYKDTIVYDEFGHFFNSEDVMNLKCLETGQWVEE